MWCILLYLRAIFVATPTGEISEVEIFLRFDGVPEPALSSVFACTCSQQSIFFRVHPLSVRELTFTCMRGSVIFSNMLDFAIYVWTTCVAYPLAAFGGSISPWYCCILKFMQRQAFLLSLELRHLPHSPLASLISSSERHSLDEAEHHKCACVVSF